MNDSITTAIEANIRLRVKYEEEADTKIIVKEKQEIWKKERTWLRRESLRQSLTIT